MRSSCRSAIPSHLLAGANDATKFSNIGNTSSSYRRNRLLTQLHSSKAFSEAVILRIQGKNEVTVAFLRLTSDKDFVDT